MQHAVWSNVQWLHVSWIVSYVEAKIVLLIKSPQKTSKQINSNQSVLKWKQTKKKKNCLMSSLKIRFSFWIIKNAQIEKDRMSLPLSGSIYSEVWLESGLCYVAFAIIFWAFRFLLETRDNPAPRSWYQAFCQFHYCFLLCFVTMAPWKTSGEKRCISSWWITHTETEPPSHHV